MAVTQCSSALIYSAEDCAEHSSDGLLVPSSRLTVGTFENAGVEEQLFLMLAGDFVRQMSLRGTRLISCDLPSSLQACHIKCLCWGGTPALMPRYTNAKK